MQEAQRPPRHRQTHHHCRRHRHRHPSVVGGCQRTPAVLSTCHHRISSGLGAASCSVSSSQLLWMMIRIRRQGPSSSNHRRVFSHVERPVSSRVRAAVLAFSLGVRRLLLPREFRRRASRRVAPPLRLLLLCYDCRLGRMVCSGDVLAFSLVALPPLSLALPAMPPPLRLGPGVLPEPLPEPLSRLLPLRVQPPSQPASAPTLAPDSQPLWPDLPPDS